MKTYIIKIPDYDRSLLKSHIEYLEKKHNMVKVKIEKYSHDAWSVTYKVTFEQLTTGEK